MGGSDFSRIPILIYVFISWEGALLPDLRDLSGYLLLLHKLSLLTRLGSSRGGRKPGLRIHCQFV